MSWIVVHSTSFGAFFCTHKTMVRHVNYGMRKDKHWLWAVLIRHRNGRWWKQINVKKNKNSIRTQPCCLFFVCGYRNSSQPFYSCLAVVVYFVVFLLQCIVFLFVAPFALFVFLLPCIRSLLEIHRVCFVTAINDSRQNRR